MTMTLPLQPLVFAVSSRGSAWRRLDWWQTIGQDAGRLPLDLDLSSSIRRRRLGLDSWRRALEQPGVASVWIRAQQVESNAGDIPGDPLFQHHLSMPHRIVAMTHDAVADAGRDLNDAVACARRMQGLVDSSTRVALVVTPVNPSGGREHLLRLQALRHRAAEWDIDLALDLTGNLDESWEAEAAMLRMAKRLVLIRFGYPFVGTPGSPAWRLRRRILAAAADVEFSGTVAIAPTLRPLRWSSSTNVALELRQAVVAVRTEFRQRSAFVGEPLRRRESP
jgi:hypothetical protein